MEFEWDEAKRRRVLAARDLDFVDAVFLFDGRPLLTIVSPRLDEMRWMSIGELNGRLVVVVWTEREERTRIISMRRARREEERGYQALYG